MKRHNFNFVQIIIYVIPALSCLILSFMGFYEAKTIAYFRNDSCVVKGILVETDFQYNESDHLMYYGKYEYEVDEKKYYVCSKYGESNVSALTQETFVYYDEKNPANSRIEIDMKYIHRSILMGVLLLISGLVIAYFDYRHFTSHSA